MNIHNRIRNIILLAVTLLANTAYGQTAAGDTIYKNLPFRMEKVPEPVIPDYSVSITDFGGVPDGNTLNTECFERAIAHLAARGGGRLTVPFGVWYTGPIRLRSHINLHLERGALVLFSTDRSDYPLVESSFEGRSSRRCMSPVTAENAEHIAITGQGVFNGSGQVWRPVKKGKMTDGQWKKLCKEGALNRNRTIWYPTERICEIAENQDIHMGGAFRLNTDSAWNYVHDYLRPALLSLINCRNILIEDATFENSPGWNLHPLMCENITLRNVTVRNPWYSQNGDGLDLESCRNAVVTDCSFDVGDDAVCIKSGRDKEGRDRGMPTEKVVIDGCRVYHGHGGFVIGSEMSGGARDIAVRNCLFIGTDTGIRLKSGRGRGGVVENIHLSGISMAGIPGDAVTFDLYYGGKATAGQSVTAADETTPCFRNIYMDNVTCRGAGRAVFLNGLPEMPISNIIIRDSRFVSQQGAVLNHVDGMTLENVRIMNSDGETVTKKDNVTNLRIK